MCLLAILWRVAEDAPLIVGANREEAYARGGTPPQVMDDRVRFVAGLDPAAGGTWLGLNEHGVLVAVTNAAKSQVPPQPRSRGLLVRDLLQCPSAREASDRAARELGAGRYAGCNLLMADTINAYVLNAGDWMRLSPLPAGIHVLSTSNLNHGADPRIAHSLAWLKGRGFAESAAWMRALKDLCGQTGGNGAPAICLHGERGGTVSSSLITLRQPLASSSYWHAQGPPDRTPYVDYSHLLASLDSKRGSSNRG